MLIKNIRVCAVASKPIERGWIQFDKKIEALGGMSDCPNIDGLDCSGLTAYPGFIDAHTHLGLFSDAQNGFDCDDCNESTSPSTPQLRAFDGFNPFDIYLGEALRSGVTTVCSAPGSTNPIGGMSCIVKTYAHSHSEERIIISKANALKLALGENPKSSFGQRKLAPGTRMGIAALIRERFNAALEYLNKKEHEFNPELDALARVLERKLPLHIHAHRADDILTAVRIAEKFGLPYCLVHGTQSNLIAKALAEKGASVMCGPMFAYRSKPELAGASPSTPGILCKAGVKTAIVTDHPELPAQYLTLSAGLAVREGMPWDDALRAITLTPAEILGIDSRVGSLESGKDADIVLFADDPLTLAAKPVMIFAGGKRIC